MKRGGGGGEEGKSFAQMVGMLYFEIIPTEPGAIHSQVKLNFSIDYLLDTQLYIRSLGEAIPSCCVDPQLATPRELVPSHRNPV